MIKMKTGSTFLLTILVVAGITGPLAVWAQLRAPAGAKDAKEPDAAVVPDLRAQRRMELRSELQRQRAASDEDLTARNGLQAATAVPPDRHLSVQEREEMRQQLREQRQQLELREQRGLREQRPARER
jgi:hypothetical protein